MDKIEEILKDLRVNVQNNQTNYCNGSISEGLRKARNRRYVKKAEQSIRKSMCEELGECKRPELSIENADIAAPIWNEVIDECIKALKSKG